MKLFFKVFITSLLIFTLIIGIGVTSYMKFFNPQDDDIYATEDENGYFDNIENENLTPLQKAIKNSKRINVLVVGLEHTRSDTIMLASYDRQTKKADIISIPRDTYYPREGYDSLAQLKINSIYGTEGIEGLMDAVEDIVGIPVDKYVTVDYDAVKAAVDALGGVEYNVPFDMVYSDPYDTPPLYINIKAGYQTLNGENALKFLRYRHGYAEGDIGRVKAQQDFIKATIEKALSFKLVSVIREVYPYINTNFSITEMLGLAGDAIGFSTDNLNTQILPGYGEYMYGVSYYKLENEKVIEMVYKMYGLIDDKDPVEEAPQN